MLALLIEETFFRKRPTLSLKDVNEEGEGNASDKDYGSYDTAGGMRLCARGHVLATARVRRKWRAFP